MKFEMEGIWAAMKGPHYTRIVKEMITSLEEVSDLNGALKIMLEKTTVAAHAEAGTFWFHDIETDGRIRPRAVKGGADLSDFSVGYGEGICGSVIKTGDSVLTRNCTTNANWDNSADKSTGFVTQSMICVPLQMEGATFGCVQIINKTDGVDFDQKDLIFVQNLMEQAVPVLRSRRFLEERDGDAYEEKEEVVQVVSSGSFTDMFKYDTFPELEEAIMGEELMKVLNESKQKTVLRHCREIWMIYQKSTNN